MANELREIVKDLMAGTIGGACGIFVGHPLDTIKVRLQTSARYKGIIDCSTQTLRHEGPLAFFKGVVAPVSVALPINGIVFVTYGGSLRYFQSYVNDKYPSQSQVKDRRKLPPLYHFLAGTVAGFFQCSFACPNELIKIQCQVNRSNNVKPLLMAQSLVRKAGLRGLYQGIGLTIMRDVPAFGIYFGSYKYLSNWLMNSGVDSLLSTLLAGGIGGSLSFLLLHPVDVLKSCRQEQKIHTSSSKTRLVNIARAGFQQRGLSFFLSGIIPSVVRAYPTNAVTFFVYEWLLNGMNETEPIV